MELTPEQKTLIDIAEKGANDADLVLLDKIHSLERLLASKIAELDDKLQAVSGQVDNSDNLLGVLKELVSKDTPAPVVNIPETVVHVQAPTVNIEPASINVSAPAIDIPAPIVNVSGEQSISVIRDGLETLEGDDRLDISAIKGLEDYAHVAKSASLPRQIFGGRAGNNIQYIDLSSQLNGVTKTFFIGTHFGIVAVDSSSVPFGAWRKNVDYREVGKNIVFDDSIDASVYLAQGQSLTILFKK